MSSELPPGFVLDRKPAKPQAQLPEGFVLDRAAPAQSAAPAPPSAPTAEPSQWEQFKAGLSAIAQDPSLLLKVGPARMVDEMGQGLGAAAKDAATLVPDVYTGRVDPLSDEGIGRAFSAAAALSPVNPAVRAGSSAIPGARRVVTPGEVTSTAPVTRAAAGQEVAPYAPWTKAGAAEGAAELRRPDTARYEELLVGKPTKAAPTVEALDAAAEAGYTQARNMGVDYAAPAVQSLSQTAQRALEEDGILAELAPKTHSVLRKLQDAPADSVAPLSGIEAARRALGHAAKDFGNPTEQLAARRSIARLDEFIMAGDPSTVVAGPAAAAGEVVGAARGNYAAARRSDRLTGVEENATRRAEASNSGLNIDNTIRQRVASLLEQPKARAGFSEEELALLEEVSRGTTTRNNLRRLGNLLGGGGGLGAMVSGAVGGMAGSALGGPLGAAAGAAIPAAGLGARQAANFLTSKALRKVDETVRMRSPLYEQMLENGPMSEVSPARRAAVLRALLAEELDSQRK